jgi:hypothetical protein
MHSQLNLQSKPELNLLMSIGVLLMGAPLFWLGRTYTGYGDNRFAAFALGCLLLILGLMALVMGETRSIELDVERKRIVLDIKRRIGGCRQVVIPFQAIEKFTILRMGTSSNLSVYYDLGVVQRSGKTVYLFGGCAFDGRMSSEWIEGLRIQFEQVVFM